jgi:hypothetical protein
MPASAHRYQASHTRTYSKNHPAVDFGPVERKPCKSSPHRAELETGYGTHDRDAQFQHSIVQHPGVVLEVSRWLKRNVRNRFLYVWPEM